MPRHLAPVPPMLCFVFRGDVEQHRPLLLEVYLFMFGHILVERLVEDGYPVVHVVQLVIKIALLAVERVAVNDLADILRQLPVLAVSPLL